MGIGRAVLTPVLLTMIVASPVLAESGLELVARQGASAPGGGLFESPLGGPWLSADGSVTFRTTLSIPQETYTGTALFQFVEPGTGRRLVRTGDTTTTGDTVDTLETVSTNALGDVTCWAGLSGGGANAGLFLNAGETLVRDGDPAPDPPGGTFGPLDTLATPVLNDAGVAAFAAPITGGAAASGVFVASQAGLTTMAEAGQPAPATGGGFDGTLGDGDGPRINGSGEVAFLADVAGSASTAGVFFSDGSEPLTAFARAGDAALTGGGEILGSTFEHLRFNDVGEVAFRCDLTGGAAITGLFLGSAGSVQPLAYDGMPLPGGGGAFNTLGQPVLNHAGQVAFQATLTGTPESPDDDEGIYRFNGTALQEIAREGDPVPDGPGVFGPMTTTDAPRIAETGQVAFVADILSAPGGTSEHNAVFLADHREVVTVVRSGHVTDAGDTVWAARFTEAGTCDEEARPTVNAYGQVAVWLTVDESGTGAGPWHAEIHRFTPELHWRGGTTTAWDDANNWTVGLQPAPVHAVAIDPAAPTTVTGPAGTVAVDALSIGDGGAQATLAMTAGGTLAVADTVHLLEDAALDLQTGALAAAELRVEGGTFTGSGGTLDCPSVIQMSGTIGGLLVVGPEATFRYEAGTFAGRLINRGVIDIPNGHFTAGDGVENHASLSACGLDLVFDGRGLDNHGALRLGGGSLTGDGPLLNRGLIECSSASGTIAGTGGFTNEGYVVQTNDGEGGPPDIVLQNTGANTNRSLIDLDAGCRLILDGADLANLGTLNLNNGFVTGTGTLVNEAGGSVTGPGLISADLVNQGRLVAREGALTLLNPLVNEGTLHLADPAACIRTGGTDAITNLGLIEGCGAVSADVDNQGTIEPTGGVLAFARNLTNQPGGLIAVATGNKALATGGPFTNGGTISLTGGTVETLGAFTNGAGGRVVGYGVLRGATVVNENQMVFSGGTATVTGAVTNAAAGDIEVAYSPAVFTDHVTNDGYIKVRDTTVTFAGGLTNNGVYDTDPADNYFTDVQVGPAGAFVGGAGDRFLVSGDFLSESASAAAWNTADADLIFHGAADPHTMTVTGATGGGWNDNFAWGGLTVRAGQAVALADDATPGGTLYASALTLEAGTTLKGDGLAVVARTVSAGAGTASLAVDVRLEDPLAIDVAALGTLVFEDGLHNTASQTITKTGDGLMVIDCPQGHGPEADFKILAGTVEMKTDASSTGDMGGATLSIFVTGAQLDFRHDQHLDTLTIEDGGLVRLTGAHVVIVKNLVINGLALGPTTLTPEPATLALVALGAAAMALRRGERHAPAKAGG